MSAPYKSMVYKKTFIVTVSLLTALCLLLAGGIVAVIANRNAAHQNMQDYFMRMHLSCLRTAAGNVSPDQTADQPLDAYTYRKPRAGR